MNIAYLCKLITYYTELSLVLFLAFHHGNVAAQETTNYTYDTLGRLTGAAVSGGPAAGAITTTQYDPAGNRSNYTVTGALSSPPVLGVIVVPLNGFTIIPILADQ